MGPRVGVAGSAAVPRWMVDDPDDPRIADFVGLRDRELRTRAVAADPRPSMVVAEGDPVVARAARAGLRLRAVLVDATRDAPLPDCVGDEVDVFAAGPEVLVRITGLAVHRGSLGLFDRPTPRAPTDVLADARRILVCERVVNPVNLGVIVRSAAGLGMDGLLLDRSSVDPYYRRASRVSMGEVFDLPHARLDRFPDGLAPLEEAGFRTVALTPAPDAVPIDELEVAPEDRLALVLGSEGPGLSAATMARCDVRVRIPLAGRVDSLNVGAAAAIACYELGIRRAAR